MKRLPIIAVTMLWLVACSETQPIDQSENNVIMTEMEKGKIEKLLSEYQQSLNAADAASAQGLYASDGIFMPAGAPSAVGLDDILKSYEFVFSQIQLNIEFHIDEILVDGSHAFATTTSRGTAVIQATGETAPEENRELFVFKKVDGSWKIARYMFNKAK